MNIKLYRIFFGILLLFSSPAITKAQGATTLQDGITIATKLQRINKSNSQLSGFSTGAVKINDKYIEHRVLADNANKVYFGYDLEVELDTENSRFKVSIRPLSLSEDQIQEKFGKDSKFSKQMDELSKRLETDKLYNLKVPRFTSNKLDIKDLKASPLPKYPTDIIVGDDDVIAVDLLENPQTKEKITDLIRVTAKTKDSLSNLFSESERPSKDFSLLDVELQMLRYEVFVNNEKKAEFEGGAVGSLLSFYVEGKGLCIFSLFPREEYSLNNISQMFIKAGRIEENKLFFKIGNDEYKIVARSPILSQGGNWNLWMMYMPQYKPSQFTSRYRKDFAFYGTDYMNAILSSAEIIKR